MKKTFHFQGFASPNYTQVPDDLFDILLPELGGAELKALLYIIRRTFGFKKTSDPISFNQFLRGIRTRAGVQLDGGCGVKNRTTLSNALKSLERQRIIQSEKGIDPLGDNATTSYRLRFQAETFSVQGVVRKVDHGSPISSPPVVRKVDRQETALQETAEHHSKSRNVETEQSTPEAIGETLAKRPAQARGTSGAGVSDREIVTAYMQSIALELRDRAPLRSTVTRLMRIYERSQLDSISTFIDVLYRAKATTLEHASSIRSGEPGARKVMPYFLAVVEDLVGLRQEGKRSRRTGGNPRNES